jgi:GTP-binding protein
VAHINRDGKVNKYKITSLMGFEGLEQVEIDQASAGDIVAVAGVPDINIGETIADSLDPVALPLLDIEQPTVKVTFSVNTSPFAGKEGKFTTSRQIAARLEKELETDMALQVASNDDGSWTVSGRGELHLAILIERLRREGFELQVSRPQVIEHDGLVPFEVCYIECPEEFSGIVMKRMGERHGELKDMKNENGITYFEFLIPTRGLFGYRSEFLTDTRGLGIINTSFSKFDKDFANWRERQNGSLTAYEAGTSMLYGLMNIQDRGVLFIGPGVPVYKGMVIGQNSRPGDIAVNACKEKHLTNHRSNAQITDHFNTPKIMGLEDALEYIGDDELVEITPQSIRIRKAVLDEVAAKKAARGL